MPLKNKKKLKGGEGDVPPVTEDKTEDTLDGIDNEENKPAITTRVDKTVHVHKLTFKKLDELREKIPGEPRQESFEQVIDHLLSILNSVKRILILDDTGILDFTIADIDAKMIKLAENEELLEEQKKVTE